MLPDGAPPGRGDNQYLDRNCVNEVISYHLATYEEYQDER